MKPIKESEAAKLMCPFARPLVVATRVGGAPFWAVKDDPGSESITCVGRACMLWQPQPAEPQQFKRHRPTLMQLDRLRKGRWMFEHATPEMVKALALEWAKEQWPMHKGEFDIRVRPPAIGLQWRAIEERDWEIMVFEPHEAAQDGDQEGVCGAAR